MKGPKKPYDVGYGRPPKHARFKKGTSGNPSGRPRRKKGLIDVYDKELGRKITITENGEKKRIPVRDVLVRQDIQSALKGAPKSVDRAFTYMQNHDPEPEQEDFYLELKQAILNRTPKPDDPMPLPRRNRTEEEQDE